jgi:hypothetical protein
MVIRHVWMSSVPSVTKGCAMPWWQGTKCSDLNLHKLGRIDVNAVTKVHPINAGNLLTSNCWRGRSCCIHKIAFRIAYVLWYSLEFNSEWTPFNVKRPGSATLDYIGYDPSLLTAYQNRPTIHKHEKTSALLNRILVNLDNKGFQWKLPNHFTYILSFNNYWTLHVLLGAHESNQT